MRMMTSCTLIAFAPDAHEVGEDPVSKRTKVKCQEMGLTREDRLQAGGQGLETRAKLLIPYDRDYHGERELEYNGERWIVYDTDPYKEYNGVILYIRPKKGNSGDATEPEPAPAAATEVG